MSDSPWVRYTNKTWPFDVEKDTQTLSQKPPRVWARKWETWPFSSEMDTQESLRLFVARQEIRGLFLLKRIRKDLSQLFAWLSKKQTVAD